MAYTLSNAMSETRRHLKDDSENVWTNLDIIGYVNEAIMTIQAALPEYFVLLNEVSNTTDVINISNTYKRLIPMFTASRCFAQDEQYYRATEFMNEFETRLSDMVEKIRESDSYYDTVVKNTESEFVDNVYHASQNEVIGGE